MKRRLITTVLGLALVFATATTAMAADTGAVKSKAATVTTATVMVDSDAVDAGQMKDGLFVDITIGNEAKSEDGRMTGKLLSGIVAKEDMTTIVNALDCTKEEKAELLKQFGDCMDIQKQINALYEQLTESTEQEADKIFAEIDTLKQKMKLFTENSDVVEKAKELGILQEIEFTYSLMVENASSELGDNVEYTLDVVTK